MDTVSLLESYFDFLYAKEIMNKMHAVFKKNCAGCQEGKLSQLSHACLSLTEYQQLDLYLEDILREVNEPEILRNWNSAVSLIPDIMPELVDMYKLKIYCRDWRETDMKTLFWKTEMYRLTCELIRLKNTV